MLKRWLQRWLGMDKLAAENARLLALYKDLVSIGIDVHFKEPAMILVYSRLNGGQIKEIRADFKNLKELDRFVKQLKHQFNTTNTTWDTWPGAKELLCGHTD